MKRDGNITREAIREAARTLFASRGFDGTSMRDIARHMGVSTANLYNYTDSKEALLWEIMQYTMERLLEGHRLAVESQRCSAGQLVIFVRQQVRYNALYPREARINNAHLESLSEPRREVVKEFRDRYGMGLRSIVEEGSRAGFFNASEGKYVSFAILAMGIGVSQWFKESGGLSVEQLGDLYSVFALRLLLFAPEAHELECPDLTTCAAAALDTSHVPSAEGLKVSG